jgi:predicted metal-dependent hydrolase
MAAQDPKSLYLTNDPSIEVLLRRSARARRYTLRVSQLDGRVTLTLPARASLQDGIAFINDKADWITTQVAGQGEQTVIAVGQDVPFEGRAHHLCLSATHKSVQVGAGEMFLPQRHQDRAAPAIKAFLKQAARDRLAAACDHYADQIGRRVGRDHAARYAVALGVVYASGRSDVFVASDHGPARSPALCRGA